MAVLAQVLVVLAGAAERCVTTTTTMFIRDNKYRMRLVLPVQVQAYQRQQQSLEAIRGLGA